MMTLITETEPGTGFETVSRWRLDGQELSFVYARSGGGMVQTGRAGIASLSEAAMTLKGGSASMVVVLGGARFEHGPQIFFTPNLTSHFQVSGVSIALANHDWLFLCDAAMPGNLSLEALGRPISNQRPA